MKLSGESFGVLYGALADAFSDPVEYELLVRTTFDLALFDVVPREATRPTIVSAILARAQTDDRVAALIENAQRLNPRNAALQALDAGSLETVDPVAIVEDATGSVGFKDQLLGALGQVEVTGMEPVAGRDLMKLLDGAADAEAETIELATIGHLRRAMSDEALRALVPVLAAAIRRTPYAARDLTRARLRRIDLSNLDLHECDLAFADLTNANLTNANLWRSRGFGVDLTGAQLSKCNVEEARWHDATAPGARFQDCRMTSAFLKGSRLAGAQFQGSRLQGAHLEGSDLTGARFEDARLADAYLQSALVDDGAAQSLLRTRDWRAAHFDAALRSRLEDMAAGGR